MRSTVHCIGPSTLYGAASEWLIGGPKRSYHIPQQMLARYVAKKMARKLRRLCLSVPLTVPRSVPCASPKFRIP